MARPWFFGLLAKVIRVGSTGGEMPDREALRLVAGSGVTLTATDSAVNGETRVEISAEGGGGGEIPGTVGESEIPFGREDGSVTSSEHATLNELGFAEFATVTTSAVFVRGISDVSVGASLQYSGAGKLELHDEDFNVHEFAFVESIDDTIAVTSDDTHTIDSAAYAGRDPARTRYVLVLQGAGAARQITLADAVVGQRITILKNSSDTFGLKLQNSTSGSNVDGTAITSMTTFSVGSADEFVLDMICINDSPPTYLPIQYVLDRGPSRQQIPLLALKDPGADRLIGRNESSGLRGIAIAEGELPYRAAGGHLQSTPAYYVRFKSDITGAGNIDMRVLPETVATITGLADGDDYDSSFSSFEGDGFYSFTVEFLGKLATSGKYVRLAIAVDATVVSGMVTFVSDPVALPGANDDAGVTLELDNDDDALGYVVSNDSGETLDGRVHLGWVRQDLIA